MINLPFSCSCTELKVSPDNWSNKKPPIRQDWYIYYRFYDPNFRDNPKFKHGKLVLIKRMNQFKAIRERQESTKEIIKQELDKLKNKAYNPITKKYMFVALPQGDVESSTPFIAALKIAEKRISASSSTKRDLASIIRFVTSSAQTLGYSDLPIIIISRKHIKQLLDHIDISNGVSVHRYNKVRSYLMMLFKELIELEAVEVNPLRDLSKRKTIQRIRKLLSVKDRKAISKYLQKNYYNFWLFMQIFFHSGARLTELMKIKKSDVNIKAQYFVITIKKGNVHKEVKRPIKNIALGYWKKAIASAADDDYIFSKGLVAGKTSIQSYQITKRWNRLVKQKLGINEDFYSLKHLNLDETAELLGINDAAAMASHGSSAITSKHYAVNESKRQNERLKSVKNSFS